MKNIILLLSIICFQIAEAQEKNILFGKISADGIALADADIQIIGTKFSTSSDSL